MTAHLVHGTSLGDGDLHRARPVPAHRHVGNVWHRRHGRSRVIHVNPGQRSSGGNPGSVAYLIGLEHPDAGDVDVLDREHRAVTHHDHCHGHENDNRHGSHNDNPPTPLSAVSFDVDRPGDVGDRAAHASASCSNGSSSDPMRLMSPAPSVMTRSPGRTWPANTSGSIALSAT